MIFKFEWDEIKAVKNLKKHGSWQFVAVLIPKFPLLKE
jgi:uncharacterized DUF497 family protein